MPANLQTVCGQYSTEEYNSKFPEEFRALLDSHKFDKITNIIRDDLGIDKLSEELTYLYTKFPSFILTKSKNEN